MSEILINDLTEELREENERLLNFFNEFHIYLQKLLSLKTTLEELNQLSPEEVLKLQTLDNELKAILSSRQDIINTTNGSNGDKTLGQTERQSANTCEELTTSGQAMNGQSMARTAANTQPEGSQSDDQLYECSHDDCPQVFTTDEQLREHSYIIHTHPYRCPEDGCGGKRFRLPGVLANHRTRWHPQPRPHKCRANGCGRRFPTANELAQHRVRRHSTARFAAKCRALCVAGVTMNGQSMATTSTNTEPERSQSDDQRLYECPHDDCPQVFTTDDHLRWHSYTVHTHPYWCPEDGCGGKRFRFASMLANHRTSRHPQPRPTSGRSAASKASAIIAGRNQCQECGQRFRGRRALDSHRADSHGLNSVAGYPCGLYGCHRKFKTICRLRNHMRVVHNNQWQPLAANRRPIRKPMAAIVGSTGGQSVASTNRKALERQTRGHTIEELTCGQSGVVNIKREPEDELMDGIRGVVSEVSASETSAPMDGVFEYQSDRILAADIKSES